jgi:hypothetical protein
MSDKDIELFWYSSEERRLFPYIDAYMSALENWLGENRMNDKQLIRYMLAGLFFEYRTANHIGENFNIITGEWKTLDWRTKTIQKFQTINQYLGRPIDTTEEYLQQLQIQDTANFAWLPKNLFVFVIYGSY